MFHYARLTEDFEHSEVEGPEVFHFVAVNGEDDWIEVQPSEPLRPEHEPMIRDLVRDRTEEKAKCRDCGAEGQILGDLEHEDGCPEENVGGFLPIRMTRRFLRLRGADFVEIGE